MEAEHIINLIDHCWFTKQLFNKPIPEYSPKPSEFSCQTSDKPSSSSYHIVHQESSEFPRRSSEKPYILQGSSEFSSQMSIHKRSKSEEPMTMSINSSCPLSPNSVLPDHEPHLDTILSGKEGVSTAKRGEKSKKNKAKKEKKVKSLSKSLSELEFEELKGFENLGFVFSEEDRSDSTLVSILPGLQRLGRKENMNGGDHEDRSLSARPYLSEAWNYRPVINWRVPSESNEVGIKDSLKLWAHTVASSVIR